MEQVASHTGGTGPDTDRQQHDIHHAETGDRERADKPVRTTLFFGQGIVRQNLGFESQRLYLAGELVIPDLRKMGYGHLFGREIDSS